MGRDAPSSAPRRLRQLLNQRNVVGFLDAAAHRHDHVRRAQVHRLLRFAEKLERPGADVAGGNARARTSPPPRRSAGRLPGPAGPRGMRPPAKRRSAARRRQSARPRSPCPEKAAAPEPTAPWSTRCETASLTATLAQRGGQLGQEIANLVGVREQHDRRLRQLDAAAAARWCKHPACSPSAARAPPRRLSRAACRPAPPARRPMDCPSTAALAVVSSSPGELAGGGQGLEGHAVPGAAALLHHRQDAHMTRASNLSFSTSWAAASCGLPSKSCACLVRWGR